MSFHAIWVSTMRTSHSFDISRAMYSFDILFSIPFGSIYYVRIFNTILNILGSLWRFQNMEKVWNMHTKTWDYKRGNMGTCMSEPRYGNVGMWDLPHGNVLIVIWERGNTTMPVGLHNKHPIHLLWEKLRYEHEHDRPPIIKFFESCSNSLGIVLMDRWTSITS